MWDLEFIDLILFLVKCEWQQKDTVQLQRIHEVGLRTGKLKFCFVWSIPVVFCLVTGGNGNAAMNFLLSCVPFLYMCTYSYATNHECYHHSFCSSISTIFLFSSCTFSQRENVRALLSINSSQIVWPGFVWYFPIPSWNHSPVRSKFLAVLFPSFFFLLVTNLLCTSSLSSGQISGFWGLDFPCYCEFIQEAPTKMSYKIWFMQQVWVLYCLHIRSMYETCVLLTCSFKNTDIFLDKIIR